MARLKRWSRWRRAIRGGISSRYWKGSGRRRSEVIDSSGIISELSCALGFRDRRDQKLLGRKQRDEYQLSMLGAPETAIKERLGHAIVDLIVSRAGCYTTQPPTDYRSVDVNIAPISDQVPHQVDAQIKATTTLKIDGDHLKYSIPKKNYDDLRKTGLTIPRVLLVADLHLAADKWVSFSSTDIRFCKAVYWLDLHDFPTATQKQKVPVRIPVENVLSASNLVDLLERGYENMKKGEGGVS